MLLGDSESSSDEDERATVLRARTDNAAAAAAAGEVPEFDIYSGEPLNQPARELRAAQSAISPSRTLIHTVSGAHLHH